MLELLVNFCTINETHPIVTFFWLFPNKFPCAPPLIFYSSGTQMARPQTHIIGWVWTHRNYLNMAHSSFRCHVCIYRPSDRWAVELAGQFITATFSVLISRLKIAHWSILKQLTCKGDVGEPRHLVSLSLSLCLVSTCLVLTGEMNNISQMLFGSSSPCGRSRME